MTMSSSDMEEDDTHFVNVITTFRNYERYSLAANNRRRKYIYRLPLADQQVLEQLGYKQKLDQVDDAIRANAEFLSLVVAEPEMFSIDIDSEGGDSVNAGDTLPQDEGEQDSQQAHAHSSSHSNSNLHLHTHDHGHDGHGHPHGWRQRFKPTDFDMDKLRSTLKQFVRDWSEEVRLQTFSTGRGGAGNIHSPSRDPSSQRVGGDLQDTHLSDAEVTRAHVANTIDLPRSSGRGGAGNISASRSRSRGPISVVPAIPVVPILNTNPNSSLSPAPNALPNPNSPNPQNGSGSGSPRANSRSTGRGGAGNVNPNPNASFGSVDGLPEDIIKHEDEGEGDDIDLNLEDPEGLRKRVLGMSIQGQSQNSSPGTRRPESLQLTGRGGLGNVSPLPLPSSSSSSSNATIASAVSASSQSQSQSPSRAQSQAQGQAQAQIPTTTYTYTGRGGAGNRIRS